MSVAATTDADDERERGALVLGRLLESWRSRGAALMHFALYRAFEKDRLSDAKRLHRGPFFAAPASAKEDRADFEGPAANPFWFVCNIDGYNVLGCFFLMEQACSLAEELSGPTP